MSVQAGIWNLDGRMADRSPLQSISPLCGEKTDGEVFYFDGPVGMLYKPRHTTLESQLEKQPYAFGGGKWATWDGRLDNRQELGDALMLSPSETHTDVEIVTFAFEKWGTDCFSRLRGDWATAIWNPAQMELILARDYMGVRHLFYYPTPMRTLWCTSLAALAQVGERLTVCDEYIAGYLAFFPDYHLTPYEQIRSVPPGAWVSIRRQHVTVRQYWTFHYHPEMKYKTDADYEEHYRTLFRQAVRRRLRTNSPILSELSGGLDSSSIVCMADDIVKHKEAELSRLDTFSYFDSNEPAEDDYAHFIEVEQQRGRVGFHADLKGEGDSIPLEYSIFPATPGFGSRTEIKTAIAHLIEDGQYRVMLSGLGGDEMNGQPLDPSILLADQLMHLRLVKLTVSLMVWSQRMRLPWMELLFQTMLQFVPSSIRGRYADIGQVENWVNSDFAKQYKFRGRQMEKLDSTIALSPHYRDSLQTIETLRRQLTFLSPSSIEKRYPFLDQELVEFVTCVPLEQILRPGQRRSLMRRSLTNLLPAAVTIRKTKTGAARCYSISLEKHWPKISSLLSSSVVSRRKYVDAEMVQRVLLEMKHGQIPKYFLRVFKTLSLELWLRELGSRGVLSATEGGADARTMVPGILRREVNTQ